MKKCAAFTLVEILVSIVLTILMVGLIASVIGASLDTIGVSTRSVEQSDGATRLMSELHRDMRGLSAFNGVDTGAFYLRETSEETTLALARLEPLTDALDAQGYVRHVIYKWNRTTGVLTRATYHSGRDREPILNTGSDSEGEQHGANVERLSAITPAYTGQNFDWLTAPKIAAAVTAAEETPLIANVLNWKVECFENSLDLKDEGSTTWSDPKQTPFAVRVSLQVRTTGLSDKFREFKQWIPVQTLVAGGS